MFIITCIIVDMLVFNLWVQAVVVGSCGTAVKVDRKGVTTPNTSWDDNAMSLYYTIGEDRRKFLVTADGQVPCTFYISIILYCPNLAKRTNSKNFKFHFFAVSNFFLGSPLCVKIILLNYCSKLVFFLSAKHTKRDCAS